MVLKNSLTLKNISWSPTPGALILDDISLTLNPDELLILVGPSGCGKSSLLKIMAKLESPTGGEVLSDSTSVGFVFQDAELLPWRTALENVLLPLEILKHPRPQSESRALEMLARVGLSHAKDLMPHQLSGGMKMRVSLARAFVHRPKVLLLDEPFAALDEPTRFDLQVLLRQIWLETKPITVFVTHSLSEAVMLGDRISVMRKNPGKIIFEKKITTQEPRSNDFRFSPENLELIAELYAKIKN